MRDKRAISEPRQSTFPAERRTPGPKPRFCTLSMTRTCHSLSDLQGRSLSDNDTHVTLSVNRHSCSKAVAETAASIVRSAQRLTSSRQSKSQNDISNGTEMSEGSRKDFEGKEFQQYEQKVCAPHFSSWHSGRDPGPGTHAVATLAWLGLLAHSQFTFWSLRSRVTERVTFPATWVMTSGH